MKAKVLKQFKDKYTGELYKVGAILDIPEKRFKEILKIAPLVEAVEETEGKPKKKAKKAE